MTCFYRYDSVRTINSYTNDIPFWIVPSSKSSLRLARPNAVEVKEFSRASKLDLASKIVQEKEWLCKFEFYFVIISF